jgi:hypothetical protein
MELRLIGRVAMLRSHGTGAAGATAVISAVGAFQTVEMGDAGRDIISGWKKAFTGHAVRHGFSAQLSHGLVRRSG